MLPWAAGCAREAGGDQPPPGGRGGSAGEARVAARVAAVPRLLRPLHQPHQGGLGRDCSGAGSHTDSTFPGACILMTDAHLPRGLLRSPPAVRCRSGNKHSRSFTVRKCGLFPGMRGWRVWAADCYSWFMAPTSTPGLMTLKHSAHIILRDQICQT